MPQKKNPCTLELIRGRTGRVYGALNGLLTTCKGLITGYNRDLQEIKHHLWTSLETLKESLEIISGVIKTMKVNEKRMRAEVEHGYTLALDLAERLVEEKGISFREAHALIGNLVLRLAKSGKSLSALKPDILEELSSKILGKSLKVDSEFLRKTISPEASLQNRKSFGSPNPKEIERMLKTRTGNLEVNRRKWLSKREALEEAKSLLRETVKRYLAEI